ncbi:SIR2 family protein [Methylobacillus flagellatus]|uniref:anti-phage defense-associated sirtuin Dsr1 n=1 Tax=Methylobacillus flagellatus TaxID=405 RepID=UPI0028540E10|nr:anti-phage defense-associated sirtuin Dsr1 [Methylobacillus flagellatus]MDR5171931.1 SIR2 family protein [Methylobacillus flagellatus]
MQIITNGPDIPNALLQAHEDGRVVFFCGAGISYPAGLPGFKGLVEEIYRLNGTSLSDIEREVFERGQFDATLDLLERRIPGQRIAVRSKLAQVLKPKLRRKRAINTQAALLRLSHSRDGALRLVTTNFDRTFHAAAKSIKQPFQSYAAPMLPIPKNSRWNGLVFLHGLLPASMDETALNRLVVTSGDFGLAYLTERWAARFVSELFRNYVVCFVGYSINDPVLRYMMDALAADRMLGENTPQAWALADCYPGEEDRKTNEWKAKGVTPILYNVPSGSYDHSALHDTLHAWAETYRDGVQGKEAIVVKHCRTLPQDSTQQDNFIGRVLWALSDKSGLPARFFADFTPTPSLDWLTKAFSNRDFAQVDLPRFGVPPHSKVNEKLRFSIVQRPAPYDRAPHMLLVSSSAICSDWDEVMFQIARWLTRHLNDPQLIIWIASQGGKIHHKWQWLIESELEKFSSLKKDGKTAELDEIFSQSPMAIPSPLMRILWRLLLSGRVKSPWNNSDLYSWKTRLKYEGLTTSLRLEFRSLLSPKVLLKKPWRTHNENENQSPSQIKQLVDWEVVLESEDVGAVFFDVNKQEYFKSILPLLFDDLQQLLRDTLDLFHELGGGDDLSDRSQWDLPSISPHWQNRGFHDWVVLIELLRDAWLAIWEQDTSRATKIAQIWFELPYPTFKRLALFASNKDDCISTDQWVRWLINDHGWWLWSIETKREVLRLIVLQGKALSDDALDQLESAILAGPPRKMFRDGLEAEHWERLTIRNIWLYLSKLKISGRRLGPKAEKKLTKISQENPEWKLAPHDKDEFSHWMSGTGDPDFEDSRDIDIAPRKREELKRWLTKPISQDNLLYEDTWRDVCRTRFFHSFFALYDLANQNIWPADRWREALQVWAEEEMVIRSWRFSATLFKTMPDDVMLEIIYSITWWVQAVSKKVLNQEKILIDLLSRILLLPISVNSGITKNGESINEPVLEALNHPVGHVTQALITLWFKTNPNDNEQLPMDIKSILTMICDVGIQKYRHGRVIIATQVIAFFRVDRSWAEEHLLPLFSWNNPHEARSAWEGFMSSPRLYQPLITAIKPDLLESANHYSELSEHRQQFSSFLTYVALGPADGFSVEDFRSAFSVLSKEALETSAQVLYQALESVADQREDYWKNRIIPFWHNVWPKSLDAATPNISGSLARLTIAAGNEFPAAVAEVMNWLMPVQSLHYVIARLYEQNLCRRFPKESLQLLNAIVSDQAWIPPELKSCILQIEESAPSLAQDPIFIRLFSYSKKF